jgi:hypothetical protein
MIFVTEWRGSIKTRINEKLTHYQKITIFDARKNVNVALKIILIINFLANNHVLMLSDHP